MSAALFGGPSFALEHLEHRDVFRVEGVSLDVLKVHRLAAELAQLRDLGLRQLPFRNIAHAEIIACARRKVASLAATSSHPFGPRGVIAGIGAGLVRSGKWRERWCDPGPARVVMDVRERRLDACDQRFAVEQFPYRHCG